MTPQKVMTPEKVLEVIEIYRAKLQDEGVRKVEYPHHAHVINPWASGPQHGHSMLDEMVEFVTEGQMDKVFRWLGFVQACLWMAGIYTLDELKDHNRPA